MNVRIDEASAEVKIDDSTRLHYRVLKFLLIVNAANALMQWFLKFQDSSGRELFIWSLLWLPLGAVSLLLLLIFRKKSTANTIPLNDIVCLQEKKYFGLHYSLKLRNGQTRDLVLPRYADFGGLKQMFSANGIRIVRK